MPRERGRPGLYSPGRKDSFSSNACGSRLLETIWHDLRYALRALTKSWGFTALAVGSLGIGLAANTALFSLVDALLLRSLPVSDPAGLVLVQRISSNGKAVPIDIRSLDVIRGLTSMLRSAPSLTRSGMMSALPHGAAANSAPGPCGSVRR